MGLFWSGREQILMSLARRWPGRRYAAVPSSPPEPTSSVDREGQIKSLLAVRVLLQSRRRSALLSPLRLLRPYQVFDLVSNFGCARRSVDKAHSSNVRSLLGCARPGLSLFSANDGICFVKIDVDPVVVSTVRALAM
jgi:hypothetical protein